MLPSDNGDASRVRRPSIDRLSIRGSAAARPTNAVRRAWMAHGARLRVWGGDNRGQAHQMLGKQVSYPQHPITIDSSTRIDRSALKLATYSCALAKSRNMRCIPYRASRCTATVDTA
jgi:hypothetical protein